MLGDTITLNVGTIAVPVEIDLKKINQDGYSAEYRLKEADREHVLIVRHAKEKNPLKGKSVDRHNVTYTQNIFPTELAPLGETLQAYAVIRNAPERLAEDVAPLTTAISAFVLENSDALINWES